MVVEDDASDVGVRLRNPQVWHILIADDDRSSPRGHHRRAWRHRICTIVRWLLHPRLFRRQNPRYRLAPGIHLVLPDVVRRPPTPACAPSPEIRGRLGPGTLKIIIRTGQPGHAPEQEIRRDYAIDGYAKKAELTRSLLRRRHRARHWRPSARIRRHALMSRHRPSPLRLPCRRDFGLLGRSRHSCALIRGRAAGRPGRAPDWPHPAR